MLIAHVLSPSYSPRHFDQKRSCRGGKVPPMGRIALNPWCQVPDQSKRHEERICSLQSRYNRRKYVQVEGHYCLCIDHPSRYRVHQKRPPRILPLIVESWNEQQAVECEKSSAHRFGCRTVRPEWINHQGWRTRSLGRSHLACLQMDNFTHARISNQRTCRKQNAMGGRERDERRVFTEPMCEIW
jgi:hypothetical protein